MVAQARSDLGEPAVVGDERRAPRRRGLGGDHAERLREDGRDDGSVRERQEVNEMPVLERAREERVAALGQALELLAVIAEADDHRAGVQAVQRLEQQLDSLVLDQLPEVDDRRPVAGQERPQATVIPLVGKALVLIPWVRRVAPSLVEQRAKRLVSGGRAPELDVDTRRNLVHALDVAADLAQDLANVRGADDDCRRAYQCLLAPP